MHAYVVIGDLTYGLGAVEDTPGSEGLLELGNATLGIGSEISNVQVRLNTASVNTADWAVPPVGLPAEVYVNDELVFSGVAFDVRWTAEEIIVRLAL